MKKFTRSQSSLKRVKVLDTAEVRAAVNLVAAVSQKQMPDHESLEVLADAFKRVLDGGESEEWLKQAIGIVRAPGRAANYGFKPADIVSAVIELERRKLGNQRGALAAAKKKAINVFVDVSGDNAARIIDRDWTLGRSTVEGMSNEDLEALIAPYQLKDQYSTDNK